MKSSRFLSIFLLCSTLLNTQITTAMDGADQQHQSTQSSSETHVSEEPSSPETPPIDEQIETSSETPVSEEAEELVSPERSQIDQQVENIPSETHLAQEVIEEDTFHESEAESEMPAIQFDDELSVSDEKPKRSILFSLLSSFINWGGHIVGNALAEGLEEVRRMVIQEAARRGQRYVAGKVVTLAQTAAPHIMNATHSIYRKSYDFSDRHPVLSLFTPSTLATLSGITVASLAAKSDLVPTWVKVLAVGGGAYFGALQLEAPFQVLRGKRFFIQQDHQDSPSLEEIFRSQPRIITKIIDTLRDQDLYGGFYYETNGTISVYGENSSAEDKRNVIRAIAREANIPVFFITKEDFENSPENALNTVLKIIKKADAAAFAYNTTCSFVCFENFMELFNEYEEIRNLISSIRLWNPLYSLHRIIFWGINQQESHDERLRDQFFSFKLQLTQSSEGHEAAAPSLKVIPQHIPTFKPINFREDKKNELA